MTSRSFRTALGSWFAGVGAPLPRQGAHALKQAVADLNEPVVVVARDGHLAVAAGGESRLGVTAGADAWSLVAHVPALSASSLGDASFREDHGLTYAYVAGEMANGIASEALVEAVTRAGMLGVFGAAGLPVTRIEQAMTRLEQSLNGLPWGVNLIHSPDDAALEAGAVELFLKRGLRLVSASAYLDLTLPVVKYRLTGIHRGANGAVVVPNRVMAKVSRVEVARKFLEPAPERFIRQLVASGDLTAEQAALAALVPMADDVTAEADSGGHTDNRPLVLLLPALQALRDEVTVKYQYPKAPRIGAAGGLATPASVATAFSMGAAYVVTGTINQACREAGTSDAVREMLAQAAATDVAMAPAADMFELGVKVQVLSRGTMFAVRAQRLYELYRGYDSIESLPVAVRAELEEKYFRSTLAEAWAGCERFFSERDPRQLERAAKEPKHKLALIFRAYLGQASHWANNGVADRRLDYQVWCGPSMGAFNEWAKGSFLESWENRRAVVMAKNLLAGAAVLTRVAALRSQGLEVPAVVSQFAPLEERALDALMVAHAAPAAMVAAQTEPAAEEPIAIVGMGSMFPKAENLEAFWRLLRNGVDAVTTVPASHWDLSDYYDADEHAPDKTYANRGAFLSPHGFDPTEFGIPPNILEATDTSQLLSLVVAKMAMDDAGYGEGSTFDRARTSVLLGVTGTQELVINLGARLGHPKWKKALRDSGVDEATSQDVVARISQSYVGWQESSFPGLLGNVIAGRIANRLDFGGTNCVIDAACASSLGAVHLAVLELRAKRSDMVLTGGVDCINDIFMHMCFSKTPALSASGDARPFSDQADGTLLGEGLGMLVLKRLSDAERDGDRIYATIRGVGTSSDGRAKSIYAPLPSGQARALKSAYAQANVRPRDIALIEAHGTGTKAGDAAEFEALEAVYRADSTDPAWCALGSVKSQIGHTKAAAGAVGMMKAALALHHKVFPPTIKVEKPNPAMKLETSPFTLSTETRPWLPVPSKPRLAAVSSFGFGGSNFHLVLEEYGSRRAAPAWDGSIEVYAFSAADSSSLVSKVKAATVDGAAASRKAFRVSHAHRLIAVVPTDGASLSALLSSAVERISKNPEASFSLPEGVHYGVGPPAGKLAFLFPGQGSQHVNMLRELACIFPEVLEAVEALGELGRAVYPAPTFDSGEKTRREERLTKTDYAQPAIGAVSRGVLEVLSRFGVKAELVAGHSYGELVALHAAGVLDASALEAVSRLRGSLMAANGADRGTMLAVLAPLAEIERTIAEEKLDVVLANRNAPTQGVLSGARAEIARAEEACQTRGLRTARLQVGAAFHSPLVAGAAKAFREGIDGVEFGLPVVPVISNSTTMRWPEAPEAAKDLLGQQLALPVRFDGVVERLYEEGARTFVEVGPKSALTGMVRAILGARPHVAMSIDAQGTRGSMFDLASALARVAAAGHSVRLDAWQQVALPPRTASKVARVKKMTVPLSGANYRAPFVPLPMKPPRSVSVLGLASGSVLAPVMSAPASPSSATMLDALRANQDSLRALQAMQEQTARIHQSFLEGQLATQQAFQALLSGQAMPVAAPVFVAPKVPEASRPVVAPTSRPVVDSRQVVLSVVAETTGYPVETLTLAMDLEADLGIDSIKRVEILSMLSKRIPGAPTVNPEKLGALKTLQHVLDFVDSAAVLAPVVRPVSDSRQVVLSVVAETTGYPVETLTLSMDLEADLGIDSIKRVEILSMLSKRIEGSPTVNPEKLSALKTLQQVLDFVDSSGASSTRPAGDSRTVVLSVVAETTGYPVETLTLSMDLEADLGIDSIKRVEILSMLSKRIPGAPSVNPEKLSALKTLQQVLDFVDSAPAAQTAAPVVQVAQPVTDSRQVVLSVVAETTGYPIETLTLSMDLEADLGIDSIKRVEILSLLSKRISRAPSVNPEKLSTLKTLQQVLDFVDSEAAHVAAPVVQPVTDARHLVLSVVAETTGYPIETLTLSMDLEADLGIDSIKRVEILSMLSKRSPGAPSVNPEKLSALKTLQQVLDFIEPPHADPPSRVEEVASPARLEAIAPLERRVVVATRLKNGASVPMPKGEIVVVDDGHGLGRALVDALQLAGHASRVIVSAAEAPMYIGGLLICSPTGVWSDHTERKLKDGVVLARTLAPKLRERKGLFVAISRRDGAFGHASLVAPDAALHGGLAGLVKTASHEWPEVRCRAIDVSSVLSEKEAASAIVQELALEAPLEVGLGPAGRVALAMKSQPALPFEHRLAKGDVIVVTGGARGVTAECARALANRHELSLLLLGRSPEPVAEADWLTNANDEAAIKRLILENAPEGERPTPKQLGEACRAVLAAREIRGSLEALASAGVRATYRSVDVRDTASLGTALAAARKALGPIRGLIHGAGVLRDKRIEDKRDDDVDQVVDTKLAGLRALLSVTGEDDLRFIALFASVTGRFGRRGQADYALANQAMVSVAQVEAARRPNCRVVALDWGPWESGMVTPALKAQFEKEGVALIPLRAGAAAFCNEVETAPGGPAEVVYGAGFAEEAKPTWTLASTHHLDPSWPILRDHRLSGRAVLPLALSLEWFTVAATHAHDGHRVSVIEDVKVLKGVTIGATPEDVSVWVGPIENTPSGSCATLELRSSRDQVHIRATARWHAAQVAPKATIQLDSLALWPHTLRQAYTVQLFHGPSLEVIEAVEGVGPMGMKVRLRAPATSADVMPKPTIRWATNPLVIDGVFQALILWCRSQHGAPSLPSRLGAWRQFAPFIEPHVTASISIREVDGASVTSDIELTNSAGELVGRLDGYVCTMSATLEQAFQPETNATPSLTTNA